ncbi:MAG: hypothetical protein M0P09_00675 [Acholeplasmataceae bacterium]|nr:hypothetical protein [Acholeplasmataceae bacterium]
MIIGRGSVWQSFQYDKRRFFFFVIVSLSIFIAVNTTGYYLEDARRRIFSKLNNVPYISLKDDLRKTEKEIERLKSIITYYESRYGLYED